MTSPLDIIGQLRYTEHRMRGGEFPAEQLKQLVARVEQAQKAARLLKDHQHELEEKACQLEGVQRDLSQEVRTYTKDLKEQDARITKLKGQIELKEGVTANGGFEESLISALTACSISLGGKA